MAIPRVGKRGGREETVNLEKTGVADNTENIEKLPVATEEDMEKMTSDTKLDQLINTYKYQLFLNKNKFLLFRI